MATPLRLCHKMCIRRHISLVLSGARLDHNGDRMVRTRCQPARHRRRSPLVGTMMAAWLKYRIPLCRRPKLIHTIENACLQAHSKGNHQDMRARPAIFHARMQSSPTVVHCRLAGAYRHRQRPIISRQCRISKAHHPTALHRSNSSRLCRHPSSSRHHTRVITDSSLTLRDLPTRLSSRTAPRHRMVCSPVRHNSRYRHMVASPSRRLMPGRHPTMQLTHQADNIRATRTITIRTLLRLP
jgi:hypothetical protein